MSARGRASRKKLLLVSFLARNGAAKGKLGQGADGSFGCTARCGFQRAEFHRDEQHSCLTAVAGESAVTQVTWEEESHAGEKGRSGS
jgi:hypothetical protein